MPPTRVVPEFACSSRSDQRSHRDDRAYRPDVAPLSIRGLIVLGATSPVIDIEPITGFTSGGVASSERQNAGGASWRAAGLESEFVLHGSPDDATQASTFVTVVGDGLRVVTSNGVREVPQVGAAVVGRDPRPTTPGEDRTSAADCCPVHARRSSSSRGTGTRSGGSGEARVVRPYVRGVSQIVPPRSRLYRWRMLPLVDVRWSGQVLEMRYVPSRSTLHTLDALLAAERAECPWLVWELRYDRGWPVVRIQADPHDSHALAAIAFVATGGQSRYAPRRPAERTSSSAVESPGERTARRW